MRRVASRCLFGLAGGGVYPATTVTGRAVRSYRTFSPLPLTRRAAIREEVVAGTGSKLPVVPCDDMPAPSAWHPAPGVVRAADPTDSSGLVRMAEPTQLSVAPGLVPTWRRFAWPWHPPIWRRFAWPWHPPTWRRFAWPCHPPSSRMVARRVKGGVFSVALSLGSRRVGVTNHRTLSSSDFPPARHCARAIAFAHSTGLIVGCGARIVERGRGGSFSADEMHATSAARLDKRLALPDPSPWEGGFHARAFGLGMARGAPCTARAEEPAAPVGIRSIGRSRQGGISCPRLRLGHGTRRVGHGTRFRGMLVVSASFVLPGVAGCDGEGRVSRHTGGQ